MTLVPHPYRCPQCNGQAHRVTHLPLPGGSTAMCMEGHEWDPFAAKEADPMMRGADEPPCAECGAPAAAHPYIDEHQAHACPASSVMALTFYVPARSCPSCGALDQPRDGECSRCGNHCFGYTVPHV